MGTITQNINAVYNIKSDLNQILIENGAEGGSVFADYPEQFRRLFRTIETSLNDISEGREPVEYQSVVTAIAPSITYKENVVTITNNSSSGTVYYRITQSDGYDQGWGEYHTPFYIFEDTYVETYLYLGEDNQSETVWLNIPYIPGDRPATPVITRENDNISISCSTPLADIWYAVNDDPYQLYEGDFSVSSSDTVYSYSTKNRKASDEAVSEGIVVITPDTPVINFANNIINITCSTNNATIQYRFNSGEWNTYTGPITIIETVVVESRSVLNNVYSSVSSPVQCIYEENPVIVISDPVITCSDNYVSITCDTSGADIFYSIDEGNNYSLYTNSFEIFEDTVIYSYASGYGEDSNIVHTLCEYEEPAPPVVIPDDPVISVSFDNIMTITCDTSSAVIYYKIDSGDWNIYSTPITLSNTCVVYSYSKLSDQVSNTVSYSFTYVNYQNEYFTVVLEEDLGYVSNLHVGLNGMGWYFENPYYSIDGGNTWEEQIWNATDQLYYIKPGTYNTGTEIKFKVKGWKDAKLTGSDTLVSPTVDVYVYNSSTYPYCLTKKYSVYGNPLSLYTENFNNITDLSVSLSIKNYDTESYTVVSSSILPIPLIQFGSTLNTHGDNYLIDARNLWLGFTGLYTNCYKWMFSPWKSGSGYYPNTHMKYAPVLPAATLVTGCYQEMFYGCSSLEWVKCLALNQSNGDNFITIGGDTYHTSNSFTSTWMYNVKSSGTFISANGTSWLRDQHGIPSGWTVETV